MVVVVVGVIVAVAAELGVAVVHSSASIPSLRVYNFQVQT